MRGPGPRVQLRAFRPTSLSTIPANYPHWIVVLWGKKAGEIAKLREPRPDGSRWVAIKAGTCEKRYFRVRRAARDWTVGDRDFPEIQELAS